MNETIVSRGSTPAASVAGTEGHGSAVSWAAVFAGAAVAAAMSLILLVLGVGLGMSAISPWAQQGASGTTLGISTILWLTLTALIASGLGGYVAGRLRSRWVGTHTDEVYFRDTAHGFLAWAVATLVTAGILTSAIGSIVGTGAQVGGSVAGAAGTAAMAAGGGAAAAAAKSGGDSGGGFDYVVDSLMRSDSAAPAAASATPGAAPTTGAPATPGGSDGRSTTAQMTTILTQSIKAGSISPDDLKYAGQLIAQKTGIPQQDAEKRVNDAYAKVRAGIDEAANKAKDAADKARKASAAASLWLFVSLLIGAFAASLAATYGGRRRDA